MHRSSAQKLMATSLALAAVFPAAAADKAQANAAVRQNSRDLRALRASRIAPAAVTAEQTERAEKAEPPYELTISLARDTDESGGSTFNAPFELTYQLNRLTKLDLGGDGPFRTCQADGTCTHDLGDFWLGVKRTLSSRLQAAFLVTVPTGPDAGSSASDQTLSLSWSHDATKNLSLLFLGRLKRYNVTDEGVSRYRRTAIADLSWSFTADWIVHGTVQRSLQTGQLHAGSTDASIELDFPIGRAGDKTAPTGALTLTRGLSAGTRHTGAQLDVTWAF